jgi:hypothetical protein
VHLTQTEAAPLGLTIDQMDVDLGHRARSIAALSSRLKGRGEQPAQRRSASPAQGAKGLAGPLYRASLGERPGRLDQIELGAFLR